MEYLRDEIGMKFIDNKCINDNNSQNFVVISYKLYIYIFPV